MKLVISSLIVLLSMHGLAVAKDVMLPKLKPNQAAQTQDSIVVPKLKAVTARPINPQSGTPEAKPLNFPQIIGKWPKLQVVLERRKCAELLRGLDMTYSPLAPLGGPQGCGVAAPILISSIQGVAINPPAEANCAMAEALYHWIVSSVKPAARQNFKNDLVGIGNASAYVCRRRNNSSKGKLSEHAIANAFDISTLKFADGSTVSIKGDWGGLKQQVGLKPQGGFLRRIRNDACIRFTTVLGPGSDPFHGDHFHVDRAQRKSGYRICK